MVDHIKPHRGDRALFWDRRNWQALASSPCHSQRKQAQERRAGLTDARR
jgi:5-methylcytosine-specific restriction endonuclease McrA